LRGGAWGIAVTALRLFRHFAERGGENACGVRVRDALAVNVCYGGEGACGVGLGELP